jgi:deazaflavin-dependent oxidoreductase (nitroreductase family)
MPSAIGNFFVTAIVRSPLHGLLGESFAVVSVTGRKTGRRISTPINVARGENGFRVVSYRSRTWWKNLRGGRRGELRVGGKTFAVAADIIDRPDEVLAGLREYFQAYPGYAKYFGILPDSRGGIPEPELERVAKDRVMIRLMPEDQ